MGSFQRCASEHTVKEVAHLLGRATSNRVFPSPEVAATVPPWAADTAWTMKRPSPRFVRLADTSCGAIAPRRNGSKSAGRTSAGMVVPSFSTDKRTPSSLPIKATLMGLFGAPWCAALVTRLLSASRTRELSNIPDVLPVTDSPMSRPGQRGPQRFKLLGAFDREIRRLLRDHDSLPERRPAVVEQAVQQLPHAQPALHEPLRDGGCPGVSTQRRQNF